MLKKHKTHEESYIIMDYRNSSFLLLAVLYICNLYVGNSLRLKEPFPLFLISQSFFVTLLFACETWSDVG